MPGSSRSPTRRRCCARSPRSLRGGRLGLPSPACGRGAGGEGGRARSAVSPGDDGQGAGLPAVQHARSGQGPGRMKTRPYGAERATNGNTRGGIGVPRRFARRQPPSRTPEISATRPHPHPHPNPLPPAGEGGLHPARPLPPLGEGELHPARSLPPAGEGELHPARPLNRLPRRLLVRNAFARSYPPAGRRGHGPAGRVRSTKSRGRNPASHSSKP
jgi:hypothetical protein